MQSPREHDKPIKFFNRRRLFSSAHAISNMFFKKQYEQISRDMLNLNLTRILSFDSASALPYCNLNLNNI